MGLVLEIRGSEADVATATIASAWSRCIVPADRETAVIDAGTLPLVVDADPVVVTEAAAAGALASTELLDVMHRLSPRITELAVRWSTPLSRFHFHAGGVARDGRAVLVVGRSGAGKTTAVRRLAQEYGYLSDETIAVTTQGLVTPYPKPLSIIEDASGLKAQRGPDEIGLGPTPQSAQVVGVLLLDRQPSGGLVAEAQDDVAAMAALAGQANFLAARPEPLRRLHDFVRASGWVGAVRYSEADQLRPLVADLLAGARL